MIPPNVPTRVRNLLLAGGAALAGFVSVVITLGALLLGLWLDAQLNLKGVMTVGVVVLSVPLSLYVMLRMVVALVGRIVPQPPKPRQSGGHRNRFEEETH